jgi:hypothetical protein
MKLAARVVLLALLPLLSGCLSTQVIQSAKIKTVLTPVYNSADKIENAAITKDGELCLFFEKHLTNSTQSHFTVVIPLEQIRTNAHEYYAVSTSGILRSTNSDALFSKLSRDKTNPLLVRCEITSATFYVSDGTIQTNWTLLEGSRSHLRFIPVGEPLIVGPNDNAKYHGLELTLLSNATETVYLTRSTPIEVAYIDTSVKRSQTILTFPEMMTSTQHAEHPGYYALLPLTVPIDIATSPIQAVCLMFLAFGNLGHNC